MTMVTMMVARPIVAGVVLPIDRSVVTVAVVRVGVIMTVMVVMMTVDRADY